MTTDRLIKKLQYNFNDLALARQALTHRSHSSANNERLEFLGDAVLNLVVGTILFTKFPKMNEGDLSRLRSNLVDQKSLVLFARYLEIGPVLSLGDGEKKSGGIDRPSILADAMEALLGAVFLDGGYSAVETEVKILLQKTIGFEKFKIEKDSKSKLQELLQSKGLPVPDYTVDTVSGSPHEQIFVVRCVIPKLKVSTMGEGKGKKEAEQQAAKIAFEQLSAL